MPLTDVAARTAKPLDKQYKLADAEGLYLLVKPNGSKLWQMKYRFLGKEKVCSFGQYPTVTLAEARDRRLEARRLLSQGIDPSAKKQELRQEAVEASQNTFEVIAKEWHQKSLNKWSPEHGAKILRRLELHIFQAFGNRSISDIKALELLRHMNKIEDRGTTEISHKVLQTVSQVFQYALILGKIDYNPAANLSHALKPHRAKHYPTIIAADLPSFWEALRNVETSEQNRLAIELLAHTFVRQGEMRFAKWEDIDWEEKVWRLPAHITKMRREHLVPLSPQTLDILTRLHAITGDNPHNLLFPSQNRQKKPMMCENTINNVLKKMGFEGKLVGHGFRALASTTLNEQGFRSDVIERQLAHKETNAVRAAYNRAEYLPERKALMAHWSAFLAQQATAKVVKGNFKKEQNQ